MNIYIISDLHIGHDNIFKFTSRPDNYVNLIMSNWKATVKDDDLVIDLGDVIFDHSINLKELLYKLPGRKVLIKGNHDRKSSHWYMQNGYDVCCESMIIKNVLFSHKPMIIPSGIQFNCHGHFHEAPSIRWEDYLKVILTKQHRLFMLEHPLVNYTPVKWERFFSNKFKCFDTLHVQKKSEEETARMSLEFGHRLPQVGAMPLIKEEK